jgi:hypothetical protein
VIRVICLLAAIPALFGQTSSLSKAEYEDRVLAAWYGQIAGTLMGFQFEHNAAAVIPVERIPQEFDGIPVDDDWYYEIVAIRGFERFGIGMTAKELGEQWRANNAGAWGSSEQARLLMAKGLHPPDTGHPRYNRLWFTIGPQFSADVYGMVAPAMPNLAARIARQYGHVNGYAEGADGAVFVAGMVSLAFSETNPRQIVRKAAELIHPESPYRQCLDLVISMAESGAPFDKVANAVEDRWHIEYPATNNAVANGGLVAAAVWYGGGEFLKTVNLAFAAADFEDADCNAANAGAVVGAMKGTKGIPDNLLRQMGDRIRGAKLGDVMLTPPVDESLTELARRTAAIGYRFIAANGGKLTERSLEIAAQEPQTQPPELFQLGDLMQWWNPDWQLQRAGVGGAGGGMRGLRGNTFLDGDVLATYPRDEVRGVVLRRVLEMQSARPKLHVEVAADHGRAWELNVHVENRRVLSKLIEGRTEHRQWETVVIDLSEWTGKRVTLRLIQKVLLGPEHASGNAYWRNVRIE